MSFAANLKKHRMAKGLSLQKLADEIGVSKAHIWDLETERAQNPSLETLQKLSSKLGVSIASLIGESPEESEETSETVVMYRDLQNLDKEDRETIKMMMERLRKRTDREEE